MHSTANCNLKIFLKQCNKDDFLENALQQILSWFDCLLNAFSYAHKQYISHRDIKSRNILIKEQRIFLTNFELTKNFAFTNQSQLFSDFMCDILIYHAFEIRKNNSKNRTIDVFALDCVFSKMLIVHSRIFLKEYQKYRKVMSKNDSENDISSYRANLSIMNQWLKQLKKNNDFEKFVDMLIKQFSNMFQEESKHRTNSLIDKKFLINQKMIFCNLHWRFSNRWITWVNLFYAMRLSDKRRRLIKTCVEIYILRAKSHDENTSLYFSCSIDDTMSI